MHIMVQNVFMYLDSIVCNLLLLGLKVVFLKQYSPLSLMVSALCSSYYTSHCQMSVLCISYNKVLRVVRETVLCNSCNTVQRVVRETVLCNSCNTVQRVVRETVLCNSCNTVQHVVRETVLCNYDQRRLYISKPSGITAH